MTPDPPPLHSAEAGGTPPAEATPASTLAALARLVERTEPLRVSDHASFARVAVPGSEPVLHGSDLLPIAFTDASLDLMVGHVQQVQDRLQRSFMVENLSAYLRWNASAEERVWTETEFLTTLARRTGCQLLVVSPGVPLATPQIVAFAQAGGEVIGDVELFARAIAGQASKVIAITGSNGKSTVTTLVGEMIAEAGRGSAAKGESGLAAAAGCMAVGSCCGRAYTPAAWACWSAW